MSRVVFERVVKRFGDVTALNSLDLEVREGEFLSLLGPSGCGKTTALRLVAGFIEPTSGRVIMDRDDISRLPPEQRNIGMVFQDYALFPHLTIAENIAFGLTERGARGNAARSRVTELLDLVKLPGIETRYPSELSGGQQQRVALARALAYAPRVLLMDEPLGALDLKLREAMQIELSRIQRGLGITTIYVTHDQGEAMAMSNRIAVMNAGRIAQLGTPEEIYITPKNKFVAQFVGKVNFLSGRVTEFRDGRAVVDVCGGPIHALVSQAHPGDTVTLSIRPEHATLLGPDTRAIVANVVTGRIVERVFAGNLLHVLVQLDPATSFLVETRPGDPLARIDATVRVAWATERTTVLAEDA